MKYLAKYWLFEDKYLAVLEDALVIVTVDKDKKPIRWAIFGDNKKKKEQEDKA